MAFLIVAELKTHLYDELVDVISREDDDIPLKAIDAGIAEVKGYLGDFDKDEIFSKTGNDRHPLVLMYCKDIAIWHFIVLANPNIELSFREKRYDRAIKWLEDVQKRRITPDLPLKPTDGTGGADGGTGIFIHGSNLKRNNHF